MRQVISLESIEIINTSIITQIVQEVLIYTGINILSGVQWEKSFIDISLYTVFLIVYFIFFVNFAIKWLNE